MRTGLRTRLTIAFVGLAIVPLVLMGLVLAWRSLQVQQSQALALQGEVARRVSTAVDSYVSSLEGELRIAADVQQLQQLAPADQKELLAKLLDYQGAFAELALLDAQGHEVVRLARLKTFGDADLGDRSQAAEFTTPMATDQTYYSPVRFDQVLGEPLMTIAIPLTDPVSGKVEGVLAADARLKQAWDVIAALSTSEGESVYIVGPDGRVIAHRSPAVVLRGTRFTVPEQDGIHTGLDGARVVLATDTMEFGDQVFKVVAEKTTAQALNLAVSTLLITAGLTAIALAIAVGVGLVMVRRIVRPIEGLATTAKAITAGDLSQRADVLGDHKSRRFRRTERAGADEISTLGSAFNDMTAQLQQTLVGLEQRVAERTSDLERQSAYLRASAEVGTRVSSILDVDTLMQQVVELIRERFGLYYVGLFVTEPAGKWAVLRAGTGEAGQKMLARDHQVQVGEGMVGWSIAHGQARVALEAGDDAVRLATPELPGTRSEAALPLRSRGQVTGALTVQHTQPGAFDEAALAVLQIMADQVAVALDNAQLFAESRAVLEAERQAYGEISREGWQRLMRSQAAVGYLAGQGGTTTPISAQQWQPEMVEAIQTGRPAVGLSPQDNGNTLAIPVRIREQVEGVVRFLKPDGARPWTPDEVRLMETLVEQLGVALDGARLYQETQRRSSQTRLAAEVTAHMRETLDVDAVLNTAVEEIAKALGLAALDVRFE